MVHFPIRPILFERIIR